MTSLSLAGGARGHTTVSQRKHDLSVVERAKRWHDEGWHKRVKS
jgi:hypothetical protein